jgi:hypothetical protein
LEVAVLDLHNTHTWMVHALQMIGQHVGCPIAPPHTNGASQ